MQRGLTGEGLTLPWVRLTELEDLRQCFTTMHLGYLSFLICRMSINLPSS